MKKPCGINLADGYFEKTRLSSRCRTALTLLEMIIALAIVGIVFSAILPQFRVIFNSWDSKQAAAEILQNGRVLINHLNNNLSRAVRIMAVSAPSDVKGTIKFQNTAGVTQVYELKNVGKYVEFGTQGNMYELAGPASSLKFTCYDACDVATTDAAYIRSVQVSATFPNPAPLGQSKTFTTWVYLRANYQDDDGFSGLTQASASLFEFDMLDGRTPALCQIDSTHYLCAYEGKDGDGWAVVLEVNPNTWNVTKKMPFEFDPLDGKTPALAKIDGTHYLCAYEGKDEDGWAVVLDVNPVTWHITGNIPFEFDNEKALYPALAQIDTYHYLCVYQGKDDDGWAVVMSVQPWFWNVSLENSFEWETNRGKEPALAKINNTRYLCAYKGPDDDGWAVVLQVNPWSFNISKETPFEFDGQDCMAPELVKIDTTHYLCAYGGKDSDGWVVVLSVNGAGWTVSKYTPFEYDTTNGETPSLIWIKDNDYLCAYTGNGDKGDMVALRVATDTWDVSTTAFYQFDGRGKVPALVRIDNSQCISADQGPGDDGWTGVLRYGVPVLP
jgi:prepilin-type N-terminal cleavage/methylation domain-containing protein